MDNVMFAPIYPELEPQMRTHVPVEVAQTAVADFTLQVGFENQVIEVTSDAFTLESRASGVGQADQPHDDRRPACTESRGGSLVNLSPGLVLINSGEGAENYPEFSVAGRSCTEPGLHARWRQRQNAVGVSAPATNQPAS